MPEDGEHAGEQRPQLAVDLDALRDQVADDGLRGRQADGLHVVPPSRTTSCHVPDSHERSHAAWKLT